MFVWGWLLAENTLSENILLLGGTGDAVALARMLIDQESEQRQSHQLTYSIAGLVRQPDLNCKVISGGFSQFGSMADYIRAEQITLVLDATHPYAQQISCHAIDAARACNIPCWRLQRPVWQREVGDHWLELPSWNILYPILQDYKRVFLTQGRLSQEQLVQLESIRKQDQWFYLRTAIPPDLELPHWIEPITAIGPFSYEDELQQFRHLKIDVMVSKNSGGTSMAGKLRAARDLGVHVLMLQRPELPEATREFIQADDMLAAINQLAEPTLDNKP